MEDSINYSTEGICDRISGLRKQMDGPRGKAAFAKRLGISPSTYDYYEGSRVPPADVLVKIADLCQVDLRWLITGEGPTQTLLVGHPAVARAAVLLKEQPDAAKPLLAFLELLSASLKFPAKGSMGGVAGQPFEVDSTTNDSMVRAGTSDTKTMEPMVEAGLANAAAVSRPGDSESAAKVVAGEPCADESWIPVLGRSAAGVVRFWADTSEEAGTTRLGDLIARHASRPNRRVAPVKLQGEPDDSVQLITLSEPDSENVVEFVRCSRLKARYADAFAVRIDGASMSPDIEHGDLVVLSPSQPALDGRPAVVQLEGQIGVTCKLYRREGAEVHLVPVNEQFPPQAFAASKVKWALRVLARVQP